MATNDISTTALVLVAGVPAAISAVALLIGQWLTRGDSAADRTSATRRAYDESLFEKREEAFDEALEVINYVDDFFLKTVQSSESYKELGAYVLAAEKVERKLERYAPSTTRPFKVSRALVLALVMQEVHNAHLDEDNSSEVRYALTSTSKIRKAAEQFRLDMREDMKRTPLQD